MVTFTYFHGCNCFCLISSTCKSCLSPVRNLKIYAALQGSLTSPNGRDSFRVSWKHVCRHYCAVEVVLYEIAAPGGERIFTVFYPQTQNRETLGNRDQISRLLFFTHLQFFSVIFHSFAEKSISSSFIFVHCLMINSVAGGLMVLVQAPSGWERLSIVSRYLSCVTFLFSGCFGFCCTLGLWLLSVQLNDSWYPVFRL